MGAEGGRLGAEGGRLGAEGGRLGAEGCWLGAEGRWLTSTLQCGNVAQSSSSSITRVTIVITVYPSSAVKASLREKLSSEEIAFTCTIPARSGSGGNGGKLGGGIAGGGFRIKSPQSLQS